MNFIFNNSLIIFIEIYLVFEKKKTENNFTPGTDTSAAVWSIVIVHQFIWNI